MTEKGMSGIYSVSQINRYIKHLFENDFALSGLWVRGEVSNCKYHSSGHVYFTLKDKDAALNCVMFASQRAGLSFRLRDGQEVEARGQVSVYEKSGSYQLYARNLRLSGQGILYERFMERKASLEEMGMFDESYKQSIPRYALRIGIVTAPTGAAIRDIETVVRRRNPYTELILYPALVQGERAKYSIAKGIQVLDRMGLDVLIVGRGGGSFEDLWAFNEEIVARAIFNAKTPVITGVGHQTDTTIADYVADLRAATPSAAAELASFEYKAFLEEIEAKRSALYAALNRRLQMLRLRTGADRERLLGKSPKLVLLHKREQTAAYASRLRQLTELSLKNSRNRCVSLRQELGRGIEKKCIGTEHRAALLAGRLDGLSPLKKLRQGYGFLMREDGRALTSVSQIGEGDVLISYLADGRIESRVERKETAAGSGTYKESKDDGKKEGRDKAEYRG